MQTVYYNGISEIRDGFKLTQWLFSDAFFFKCAQIQVVTNKLVITQEKKGGQHICSEETFGIHVFTD